MADENKLTPSDEAKLIALEKQLAKEKTAGPSLKKQPVSAASNQTTEKQSTKYTAPADKGSRSNSNSSATVSSPKPTPSAKGKTGILWFFTIINLVLLAAIIGAGYWAWMQWQVQSQQQIDALAAQKMSMQQQQSSLQQQRNSLDQQQNNIAQSIASNELVKGDLLQQNRALQGSLQNLSEQIQLTQAQAQTNQRNLADISGRRPADWLLAEADYLVRIAGRKLWLEHDVKTAIMMLQSADSRIQDLDDPSLLPLRALLAEDLLALQQINQVSTSSIAIGLGAMINQIDSLPLAFFKRPEAEVVDDSITGSINDWRANLARNWREATKNFFSFKKVTTEIKPFMSEQQQWLAKEQLRFALLQAQVAVLQENAELYQQALKTALSLLVESFDTENESVVQFTGSLSRLQVTDFEKDYPQQFNVAPLLKDLIEQRLDSRFVNGSN
ncbi:uroporphyrinogen-III C-methyltransferase [uncultured Paraglaciecola sp.]|uniref:uroporphyrinogen-III C-methyltransferase n=1 Tax=uncultured Paraglaciecola sp. TaxID=1765024 RepID=UPI0030D924E2|tara:strand:- start:472479 stop:473807 length:1329 start_codon:yes stop_codon:yes gene_type:complete